MSTRHPIFEQMLRRARWGLIGLCACLPFMPAAALAPDVQSVMVTDVTPRSFSIVWLATPGSTPSLDVFEAPGCDVAVSDARVEAYPTLSGRDSLASSAAGRGVMKVRVSGLQSDTNYCYQTRSTAPGGEETVIPFEPALVRTAQRTARVRSQGDDLLPFANDLIRFEVDLSTPGSSSDGLILVARVEGASAPATSFIGDGIDDDDNPATPTALVLVDLNNLYSRADALSLNLSGDGTEGLVFVELGGPIGAVPVHARIVPPDNDLSEIVDSLNCPEAAAGALCDGLLGDSEGDATPGDEDPDAIAELVVGTRSALVCPVCSDVDFDGEISMRDALAIAQFLRGLRGLP